MGIAADQLPYRNPTEAIERRVEDLLRRMTLKEKIGQLNIPIALPPEVTDYADHMGISGIPITQEECERFAAGTLSEELGPGGGFFMHGVKIAEGPAAQAEFFNGLQRIAAEQTRLGVPHLNIEAGVHGVMVSGATIFPEGLSLGSMWDVELIGRVFGASAAEARAIGVHELSTIVVEPIRDPRLGRNCEGFGEDPYLLCRFAEAIVRAVQGDDVSGEDKVLAELCHYPGQSQPVSGLERGAMEISERALRETFLPSFVAGFRAGALATMATYPTIDGVPAHASEWLLSHVLRDELGFDGIVVSEGMGFGTLLYEEMVASQAEAGRISLHAGVDVNISYEEAYRRSLLEAVESGDVSEALIDRAVSRVLGVKFRLGLFENPYADPDRAVAVVNSSGHRDLALRAAKEGIVLLRNEGETLPLSRDVSSIAVIGPNADAPFNQLGDYTIAMMAPVDLVDMQPITTVLDGIRLKVPRSVEVTYTKGCDVVGEDDIGIPEAVAAARSADVAVVVVGEQQGQFQRTEASQRPTVGEGADVASLDLTGVQEELVKAVVETGTPTVVVLINGRPLSIRWIAEHVPAIVEAWLPGERGGEAVADVLFGDHNPSGRLAITIPRHVGQLPCYYNHRPSKNYSLGIAGMQSGYRDMPSSPLYPFGYGLSYTTFAYSNLRIDPTEIPPQGTSHVSVDVTNTGSRGGQEVVQLYIHDVLSSVSTPVKQLRGFAKVPLGPGETKTVSFGLGPEELALLDRDLNWTVEPGAFEVMVGSSSEDLPVHGELCVRA